MSAAKAGPTDLPAVDAVAEKAVLGSLLLLRDTEHVEILRERGLTAQHFYWRGHGSLYAAALALAERRDPLDEITLSAEVERLGLGRVDPARIEELATYVPATGNYTAYADRLIALGCWRARKEQAHALQDAIARRSEEAWDVAVGTLIPARKTPVAAEGLRLVDRDTGELVQRTECSNCQGLEDQLSGASREIRGWRSRYADLAREKQKEAAESALWPVAMVLFGYWKTVTKHKRSQWTYDRFHECETLLQKYGPELCERAIAGIAFDPFVTSRKNGSQKRHDGWHLIFGSADKFEEYANRAPRGWKSTLQFPSGTVGRSKPAEQPTVKAAS